MFPDVPDALAEAEYDALPFEGKELPGTGREEVDDSEVEPLAFAEEAKADAEEERCPVLAPQAALAELVLDFRVGSGYEEVDVALDAVDRPPEDQEE